jgi:hypothetical protein
LHISTDDGIQIDLSASTPQINLYRQIKVTSTKMAQLLKQELESAAIRQHSIEGTQMGSSDQPFLKADSPRIAG